MGFRLSQYLSLYIIKQNIRVYIYMLPIASQPNSWTQWAEILFGHSWVAWGCHRLKNSNIFVLKFFFPRQRRALQLVNLIQLITGRLDKLKNYFSSLQRKRFELMLSEWINSTKRPSSSKCGLPRGAGSPCVLP